MSSLRLQVDGVPFDNFLSFSVSRSIDQFSGTFSISASDADKTLFPIKLGSRVRATINDVAVLTGYVESISPSVSAGSHAVDLSGRDVTADLIDSTLSAGGVELTPPVSFVDVINRVQTAIGTSLEVKNNVSGLAPFTPSEIASCKAGDGAFSFLEKFARARQVLLNTDGEGRITISRNSKDRLDFSLINRRDGVGNNVLTSSATYSNADRFYKYVVVSQANLAGANDYGIPDLEDMVSTISKPVIDNAIRKSRTLYLVAEKNSSSGQSYERAVWECNFRKAKSRTYSATLDGLVVTGTDSPFPVNRLVQVEDEDAGISATMLIKAVSFSVSSSGEETSLTLVNRDAYSLELSDPSKKTEVNPLGQEYEEGE